MPYSSMIKLGICEKGLFDFEIKLSSYHCLLQINCEGM